MKYDKETLRKKFISLRKKNFLKKSHFNFNLLFNIIVKFFSKQKIIIAGYYPSNHEVDILNFMKMLSKKKYKIALPVIGIKSSMSFKLWKYPQPLHVNNFGILEPKNRSSVFPDLILVPLVAFDGKLNRIGYGKGYYDRGLKKIKKVKKKMISIGIAYSFQKCKKIPVSKHDFKLDYIFTERGLISQTRRL